MRDMLVIADPATADVFRLASVDVWTVDRTESPEPLLRDALVGNHAVIFITESVAESVKHQILAAQTTDGPVVVVIPGVGTSGTLGREMLSDRKRAVAGGVAMR
jgi:vacuolar-type H+-ATPase subunit F/Vma7